MKPHGCQSHKPDQHPLQRKPNVRRILQAWDTWQGGGGSTSSQSVLAVGRTTYQRMLCTRPYFKRIYVCACGIDRTRDTIKSLAQQHRYMCWPTLPPAPVMRKHSSLQHTLRRGRSWRGGFVGWTMSSPLIETDLPTGNHHVIKAT